MLPGIKTTEESRNMGEGTIKENAWALVKSGLKLYTLRHTKVSLWLDRTASITTFVPWGHIKSNTLYCGYSNTTSRDIIYAMDLKENCGSKRLKARTMSKIYQFKIVNF